MMASGELENLMDEILRGGADAGAWPDGDREMENLAGDT